MKIPPAAADAFAAAFAAKPNLVIAEPPIEEMEGRSERQHLAQADIDRLCDAALKAADAHVSIPNAGPLPMKTIVIGVLDELLKFSTLRQKCSIEAAIEDRPASAAYYDYLTALRGTA